MGSLPKKVVGHGPIFKGSEGDSRQRQDFAESKHPLERLRPKVNPPPPPQERAPEAGGVRENPPRPEVASRRAAHIGWTLL